MFKLYKRLRPIDWILLTVLVGLTVVQVYCTMTLVDQIQNIIRSITYVNYHNHPEMLDEAGAIANLVASLGGWENVTVEALEQAFLSQIMQGADMSSLIDTLIDTLIDIANATTGDIWYYGGLMLAVAAGSALAQALVGLIASHVGSQLSKRLRTEIYNKVDGLSIAERDRFSTPSLITRTTNDVQQVQMANVLMLRMAFAAPITAVWAISSGELATYGCDSGRGSAFGAVPYDAYGIRLAKVQDHAKAHRQNKRRVARKPYGYPRRARV